MCELFGVCSRSRTDVSVPLREFFTHSVKHDHGWGMAVSFGAGVSLEKEPLCANSSHYLKERLRNGLKAENMLAHIRLASVGRLQYVNTHPFLKRDNQGGCWTLAHNGTLFNGLLTDRFAALQEGQTDSERILLYLVEAVDKRQEVLGRRLLPRERFGLMEELVTALSDGNKLNLLVWDGEYLYVHTNYADTLYYSEWAPGSLLFSTQPLTDSLPSSCWHPLPFLRLMVYKDGRQVYAGRPSSSEYRSSQVDFEYKDLDYAHL